VKFENTRVVGAGALAIVAVALTACQDHHADSASRSPSPTTAAATISADDQLAIQALDALVRGDFASVTAHFDITMSQTLTPEALASAWDTYQHAFGTYQSHGDPHDVPLGALTVVNVPLQMQAMPGEFRITFHPDSTVAGLYFLKTGVPIPGQ
jgi:hypothetical protein